MIALGNHTLARWTPHSSFHEAEQFYLRADKKGQVKFL